MANNIKDNSVKLVDNSMNAETINVHEHVHINGDIGENTDVTIVTPEAVKAGVNAAFDNIKEIAKDIKAEHHKHTIEGRFEQLADKAGALSQNINGAFEKAKELGNTDVKDLISSEKPSKSTMKSAKFAHMAQMAELADEQDDIIETVESRRTRNPDTISPDNF